MISVVYARAVVVVIVW